jgi:hypothetical protein
MITKIINIAVPLDWTVPEIMETLNPEENGLILTNGSEMIKEARKMVRNLSQQEIYNKIHEEKKIEIQKLEMDLIIQKTLMDKMCEQMKKIYELQIVNLQNQVGELNGKIIEYVNNNDSFVKEKLNRELEKEREKIEKSLEKEKEILEKENKKLEKELEKERENVEKHKILFNDRNQQVLRLTENYDKFLQQQTKTIKKLGDEGEDNFMLLSETFKDFSGYKIERKSHQAHKGDFHIFFENFSILVDLKNYTTPVQKKEIEKIEHDLLINDTIDFAWLISYESNISDWSRFPIMCKWLLTDIGLKCTLMLNKLNSYNNPTDILRIAWLITNEVHQLLSLTKDKDKNNEAIKVRDYNILQKIKTAHKRISELKRNILSMSQISKDLENDLLDAISLFTNELSKNEYEKTMKIREWWDSNVEYDGDNKNILKSTEIWTRFKKQNKLLVDDNKITIDDFKNYIKSFVDNNNYVEKSKNGAMELIGFRFNQENYNEETEKIQLELIMPIIQEKKKKAIKKSNNDISEDIELNIINQYNTTSDDVLKIAKDNNIKTWQVVSILCSNKIISKRSEARGYEIYKETDEYKSKIISANI